MDRRHFLKRIGINAVSLSLLSGCSESLIQSARSPRPNVLFIAVDDLNDWIGCLGGHPDAKTPNIDALAGRGVLFTNAHCASPACNPSRAAILSGFRPSTSGVYGNKQPWRESPVLNEAVTLPQHFMAHGYTALGSGKIYHNRFPDPASWDDFWPAKTRQKVEDPFPALNSRPLAGSAGKYNFDWGPMDVNKEEMGDWKVSDWTIKQLQKKHDKPFFLACGIFRPHLPWYVPQEYFDRFPIEQVTLPKTREDDLDDVPPAGREMALNNNDHLRVTDAGTETWRKAVQAYLACSAFADDCVGRVIQALDNSAYRDNTIIVLWSDHGWHLGEKLHWRKFTLWEEATRNPLIFVAPGVTAEGKRCDESVSLLDIYPTLIDLCNLGKKPELEGQSLIDLLSHPHSQRTEPALTTWGYKNHSVRSRHMRYIRYEDGSEELYDHRSDPMEWTNLANQPEYSEVKKKLMQWIPKKNNKYVFSNEKET